MKIAVFGCGAYGMALSNIFIDNKHDVTVWTRFEEEKASIEKERATPKLPGFVVPSSLKLTTSIEECAKDKQLLVIAIPAAFVDSLCQELKKYYKKDQHILIATKGIEQGTGLFMHSIVEKYIKTENIAVISGPSFAVDLITRKPAGLSLACKSAETTLFVKEGLRNQYIKVRETYDIYGVEICGSIKNVIALAAGMLEGLKANDSTKAMLITEAVHDMEAILEAFNCEKRTVLSFAGIGDLLLTCNSPKSRNFSFGKLIGERPDKEVIDKYLETTTVEGYYTLESIYQLLKDKQVFIPIIDLIYEIIVEGKDPELLLMFLIIKS
jgi:glycerol-3-phosphate dehydrogenase (NAD(P)+)